MFTDVSNVLAACIIRAMDAPDDGSKKHLRNVCNILPGDTATTHNTTIFIFAAVRA
jgi:hypothetical protein